MNTFRKALCCLAASVLLFASCIKSSTIIPHHPPPAIGALSPSHGPDSTLVTITGAAFSDTLANDAVFFNGKQAVLVSASDTALVAMVPTLAGTGAVTVTVDGLSTTSGNFNYDTTYRITTVADGIQGLFYITMDANGNLYFSDYNTPSLDEVNPQGVLTSISPLRMYGVVADAHNNLFVAVSDGLYTQIERFSPGGSTLIATDSGALFSLAIDTAGNIYGGNVTTFNVDKITPQGVITPIATGLFSVSGVAAAPDGTVYATNYSGTTYTNTEGVITKISPSGQQTTFAKFLYGGWAGITLDANNNVYVSNFDQEYALGDILRFGPDGSMTPLISANLNFPCGLVRDNSGNFYVVQTNDAPGVAVGGVIKMTMH
jgi:hypothetical protein